MSTYEYTSDMEKTDCADAEKSLYRLTQHDRSMSSSSSVWSASTALSADPAAGSGAAKKVNVNVYTTCGRHSNEWLFSGWPWSSHNKG